MTSARQPGIDVLKVIASQLIVCHHLAAYGPIADAMHQAFPGTMGWLYDYGRMAVQVFLVLGGFLAVQQLLPAMTGDASLLWRASWQRYLRLTPPLLVALLLAVAAAAWARPWLPADVAPSPPGWGQWLAHALLLHEVLGADALSAGVWYVAIDFQLYLMLASLLWLGQRGPRSPMAQLLVVLAMLLSLLFWNRQTALDIWPVYFFGAYALGVVAHWAASARGTPQGLGWTLVLVLSAGAALLVEERTRIALALAVALWLALGPTSRATTAPSWLHRLLAALGRSSYALFLTHFSWLLLGNALWAAQGWGSANAALLVFACLWGVSLASAWAFERWVEAPMARRWRR